MKIGFSNLSSRIFRADGRLVNMSGDFCTNNAQAPSLFSNVTSRRTKLMVCETVSGNSALLHWLKKGTVAWNCFTDHQLRASACYVGEEGGSLCIVCAKISRHFKFIPIFLFLRWSPRTSTSFCSEALEIRKLVRTNQFQGRSTKLGTGQKLVTLH